MPKNEDSRIPIFTCRNKRVIKNVIREIGKEKFEKRFAALGKEMPEKLYGFSIQFKAGKFSLYHQWVSAPIFIMDVTPYMGLSEDWYLIMKSV